MMTEIYPNIYLATTDEYPKLAKENVGILNLASNEHYKFLGWTRGINHQDDPSYIRYEVPGLLSMNWIDGPASFYDWKGKGVENFTHILDWIQEEIKRHPVVIACNQGLSRSPSIALLYLAKRVDGYYEKETFDQAYAAFRGMYPAYKAGGIAEFIKTHWGEIK